MTMHERPLRSHAHDPHDDQICYSYKLRSIGDHYCYSLLHSPFHCISSANKPAVRLESLH